MAHRLEPVDRWDEAAQRWVTVWVTVPCQESTKQTHCPRCGHAEASESPKLCWWCAPSMLVSAESFRGPLSRPVL